MKSRLHARVGTLRQMEILLAVYRTGTITGAAAQLHLTQPTVSMQLSKLADSLGIALYYSVGKKIRFTDAGEAAVQTAIDVLACFERLDMTLSGLQGLMQGTLNLSIVTTAKYFIPHLIGDFSQLNPQIDARFRVGNRRQIIEQLNEGADDFYVFSHPPANDKLELIEFLSNRLVAIAPKAHPLAQQKTVTLDEFCQAPFLMREEGSGTRHAIDRHLAQLGQKLNVRMTIESNEAIKYAVMSGMGVSILSEHTLAFGDRSGLAILEVEQLSIITHWYLVRLKHKPMSPVAKAFLEFIQNNSNNAFKIGG